MHSPPPPRVVPDSSAVLSARSVQRPASSIGSFSENPDITIRKSLTVSDTTSYPVHFVHQRPHISGQVLGSESRAVLALA